MKIASIALKSFRSGENLELGGPAPVIYICGRNGAGKSSVREAIRWTLRGVCSATDKKGLGWEDLMPAGRTNVCAELDIPGVGKVERAYANGSRELTIEGRPNSTGQVQEAIYGLLNVTPEFLDACLETDYFVTLHHADSKAFILGLLNVRIPYEGKEFTLDEIDNMHDVAFKARTVAKGLLKAYKVPPRPASQWPEPVATVAEVESKLAGLEMELRGHERIADTNKGKREGLQARLEQVQRDIARIAGVQPPPPDAVPTLERKVRELMDAVSKAKIENEAERHASAPPAPDGADFEQIIETLTAHKPTKGCVLDNGVECKTAKIVFTNRVKWYRAEQARLKDQIPLGGGFAGSARLSGAPDLLLQPRQAAPEGSLGPFKELAEAQAALRDAMAQEAAYKAQVALAGDRGEERDALTAQLASLPIGTDPVDMTGIETLRARVAKGKLVLEALKAYWREMDAHTYGLQRESALKADVDKLEARVADLGPNGVRVEALKKSVGAFEEAINRTTKAYGWAVAFQIQPWEVQVNGRPLTAFSESERFRIGIAIQIAVAQASGLKFIVVDRLDMLDRENRGLMTNMLVNSTVNLGFLEQVVILSTREDDQPLPQMAGQCTSYRLAKNEQGQTVIAEAKA